MAAITLSMGLLSFRPRHRPISRPPIHPPPLRYNPLQLLPAAGPPLRLRALLRPPSDHENSNKGGDDEHPRRPRRPGPATYDVFLSFHGRDVRHNFVDHLYAALVRKGVKVFKDDIEMPRGRELKQAISAAIQDSSLYLLVISPGYASSSFCLDEAFEITQRCRGRGDSDGGRVALPIFYNVCPSDVCNPKDGCFKEQFKKHFNEFTYDRVRGWMIEAFPWIGSIKGWVHENGQSEALLVEEVTYTVVKKVSEMRSASDPPLPPSSPLHLASSRSDHYDGEYMELEYFPPQISSTQGNDRIVRIPKPAYVEDHSQEEDPLPYSPQLCLVAQHHYLHADGRQPDDIATITAEARSLWKEDRIELKPLEMTNTTTSTTTTSTTPEGTDHIISSIVIRFPDQDTRNWVLESSPWLISGTQFFMRKWKGPSSSLEPSTWLLTVPMWVRLYDVPVEYMNPKGLSYIASALGKPMYVDRATADDFYRPCSQRSQIRPYAKVCVEISPEDHEAIVVGFRLERTMVIAIGDEKENLVVVTAVYQQLEARRYI